MNPNKLLATIIEEEMNLNNGRVVLYDQNFKAPKDRGLFIVISTGSDQIIANTNKFDTVTNEQVQKISKNTTYWVEITSRNMEAAERRHEVLMAINSNYSIQQMEKNNVKIFRTNTIQDLSFIDGSSSLHRYRIPVIINNMSEKRSVTDYFDNFQTVEVESNE